MKIPQSHIPTPLLGLPYQLWLVGNPQIKLCQHILTPGGKPPARVTSSVSGIIASSGKVASIAQPVVVIPPTNTNVIPPASSSGQPLWVQPMNNQLLRDILI